MTTRYTSSCAYVVSILKSRPNAASRISLAARSCPQTLRYASRDSKRKPPPVPLPKSIADPSPKNDAINPPLSTLPPPLNKPERGNESGLYYLYYLGRAYGTFYKDGIKAVWSNHKAAKAVKRRVFDDLDAKGLQQAKRWKAVREAAVQHNIVSRAEFQMLERNAIDIGKLPFFGLLVLLFGEWLPLIVPFIPNAVPGTCRIPKQVMGMRQKSEERRRWSFRQGIEEPEKAQLESEAVEQAKVEKSWPLTHSTQVRALLKTLRPDQLMHLSCTLNTHSRLWDRVQLPPPVAFLRHRLRQRLQYLALDDLLLSRSDMSQRLRTEEATIACEERGLDVVGREETSLREQLQWWIRRQSEGEGSAMMEMLFRRPNAWKTRQFQK